MDRKTSEVVYGDIRNQLNKLGGIQEKAIEQGGLTLSDRVLSKRLQTAIGDAKFHKTTERAIAHLQKSSGGKLSRYKAITILERESGDQLFMPFGNLDRSRKIDLPVDFYERDVSKILDRYTQGWARRVSEAEAFGANGEGAFKLLEKLAKEAPEETLDAQQVISGLLRITESNKQVRNRTLKKLQDSYVNFRVATAIGLGFAVVPNMTQTLISTYMKHGGIRTARGLFSLATKEGRRNVGKSGSTWMDAHFSIFGSESMGPLSDFAKTTTTLFNVVNTFNKALASSTAGVAIPEYWAKAQGKGYVAELYRRRLKAMGIDHTEKLTKNTILEGMNRFANDSQLMRNVLNEPLWMGDPRLRALALFKRFGYRQATYVKDNAIKDFRQDPLPFLRLMAGGVVGGKFVEEAKDALREWLGGEKQFDHDKPIWKEAMIYLSASGAAGMLTDISNVFDRGGDDLYEGLYGNIGFAITPIIMDDMFKAANLGKHAMTSKDRRKWQAFSAKLVNYYGGSVTKYAFGQRIETFQQKKRRRSWLRKR